MDYFLARYYSSAQGRFSSPDEPFADQDEANPQSWNLYSYVRNNPLNNTDPNGRETCFYTKSGEKVACLGQKGVEVKGEQLIVRGNVYDLNRLNAATNVKAPISDIQMTPLARGVFTELDRRAAASLKLIDIAANITLTPISIISGSGLFRAGAGLTTLATGAAEASSIRIGARGLAHVLGRHAAGGARTAGKSLFNGGEGEIVSLIREAGTVAQVPQAGGNFARVVDAGRIIGVDRATGAPTSVYTVITNAAHELVTAFPGRP